MLTPPFVNRKIRHPEILKCDWAAGRLNEFPEAGIWSANLNSKNCLLMLKNHVI